MFLARETCLPGQWVCQRGECIPEEFRCDGDLDCDDKSDEMGCRKYILIVNLYSLTHKTVHIHTSMKRKL